MKIGILITFPMIYHNKECQKMTYFQHTGNFFKTLTYIRKWHSENASSPSESTFMDVLGKKCHPLQIPLNTLHEHVQNRLRSIKVNHISWWEFKSNSTSLTGIVYVSGNDRWPRLLIVWSYTLKKNKKGNTQTSAVYM